MGWMQNLSSALPYMVVPGNHESECHSPACIADWPLGRALSNFTAYNARWHMPSAESGGVQNMWYARTSARRPRSLPTPCPGPRSPPSHPSSLFSSSLSALLAPVCPPRSSARPPRLGSFAARTQTPALSSSSRVRYSFNYGAAHFVSINTETDFPGAEERRTGDRPVGVPRGSTATRSAAPPVLGRAMRFAPHGAPERCVGITEPAQGWDADAPLATRSGPDPSQRRQRRAARGPTQSPRPPPPRRALSVRSHVPWLRAGGFGARGEYLRWLEADLRAASDARRSGGAEARPWLLVGGHRPYEEIEACCAGLFAKYGVDVYFSGHVHSYRRAMSPAAAAGGGGGAARQPRSNGTADGALRGATTRGTAWVVVGGAGCDEMQPPNRSALKCAPPGSSEAVTSDRYATGVLSVSPSRLSWRLLDSTTGGVLDDFTISR